MNGCIYRTKDGECDLYVEGGKYRAYCVGDEPCDGRKQSNADRIRAMTDEELAYEIVKCKEADKFRAVVLGDKEYTVNEWLDWLRQEAST